MNGSAFREVRLGLRLSQGALTQALNARLGRKYDKPKVSRWENGHEPVPAEIEAEIQRMLARQPVDVRAIVLANQKGGVGKTTSALNLACALTHLGKRVLLVDLDPQATATTGLLAHSAIDAYRQRRTVAHVILGDVQLADIIIPQGQQLADGRTVPFDMVASHIELSETDGKREPGFDVAVREALEPSRGKYDWIVLDAPPNLGMLTWMALAAAEQVIIPVRTEPYDTMGVGLILSTINKVQRRLNPGLRLTGILPTQFDRRKSVDREVLQHLISSLGPSAPVLAPVPSSAVFGHAARNGQVAVEASPGSAASAVYIELARTLAIGASLPRATPALAEPAAGGINHGDAA